MLEIKNLKGMDKKEAEALVDKYYFENGVTYNGDEFWSLYENSFIPTCKKVLTYNNELDKLDGQEVYLGYLPKYDVFVSGWDVYECEDGKYHYTNTVYFKYEDNIFTELSNTQNILDFALFFGYDFFYSEGYDYVQNLPTTVIDIRLD